MKICPIISLNSSDMLLIRDYDITEDAWKQAKKVGALLLKGDMPEKIEILKGGVCREADCAWWSEERKCCGVVR